jgi:hypothetical protein
LAVLTLLLAGAFLGEGCGAKDERGGDDKGEGRGT